MDEYDYTNEQIESRVLAPCNIERLKEHRQCEFFPCHKGVEEDKFNCLFCYCPLYMLGNECGGNFKVTNGVKDCSGCTKPHAEGSYDFVMSKIKMVIQKGSSFIK